MTNHFSFAGCHELIVQPKVIILLLSCEYSFSDDWRLVSVYNFMLISYCQPEKDAITTVHEHKQAKQKEWLLILGYSALQEDFRLQR